jgi:fructose-specific phosphotransferase system component IIB
MAEAEAASRSAREVGAETQPAAKLKVTLADEQIAAAKARIAAGDNKGATYLLLRARADAELALALAHEQNALNDKQKATQQSSATLEANKQGATP